MLNDQPTPETMFTIAKGHRKYGTTSLLPTLITDTTPVRDRAIEAAIEAVKADKGVAGLHLEGPHLAPARKGAHLAELMRPVNDADIALYIHTAKQIGTLLVTLAAEQVTPDQVRRLSDGGVVVSIGHSDTTADEAFKRFDAGARSVTHLFNAMSQIGHRAPGWLVRHLIIPTSGAVSLPMAIMSIRWRCGLLFGRNGEMPTCSS